MELIGSMAGIVTLTLFAIIPIILVGVFTLLSKKNSKLKKYRNFSLVLLIFGSVILFFVGTNYITNIAERKSNKSSNIADGFTIEDYKINLNVHENNIIDVTETITVNFYKSGLHGIYKIIPNWLEYTDKNGKTISRKSKTQNLKALDEEYTLEKVNDKEKIKIGSPDSTVSTRYKTYTITYQYDMGKDPYNGFDEFIFHAFGDYWGTSIKNASLEIKMPTTIKENSIKFFADKYRKQDITSYMNYYTIGNTLYAQLSSSYDLQKSLTIDLELPEGYFKNTNNTYGSLSLLLCLTIIIFTLITFIKWLKHGKDLEKVTETVEFSVPENYDSASIGYIFKKESGRKLAISLIVELASKGFIKIEETEDETTRTIINLCPFNVSKAINRTIYIKKIKDATKPTDMEILMEYFPNGISEATIDNDFDNFYSKTEKLVSKGYIKIEKDTINEYSKEELDNISNQLKEEAFKGKPVMTSNEKIVYDKLFAHGDYNVLSEDKDFYKVFDEITTNLQKELDDKINDVTSYKNMAITSALFFLSTVYFRFAFCNFKDLNPIFNWLYFITFCSIIITFILSIFMKRKNTEGERLFAKIISFRNYLETAEKAQLEALINSNPNYFYDILPYAYVLGVSKSWIEKFENIPVPQNDMGNFNYCNMDSFNELAGSVSTPSSSSSGGGCGGGCSSCGGGGSW